MPDADYPVFRSVHRYGIAVMAVAAATLLRWLLHDLLGDGLAFITFYPAVALVAMVGGGPGVLATVLSVAVVDVWILAPLGIHSALEAFGMGLFTTSCLIISAMGEMLRRSWRYETSALEQQVVERTSRLTQANVQLRKEIEERQRAEALLRESEERLRLALDIPGVGTWDWNLQTGQVVWSEEHFRMLGYEPTPGPVPIEKWSSRLHPEDRERVLRAVEEAKARHSVYRPLYRILRAESGCEVWIEAYGHFLYDEEGQPVRMNGVMWDVTDRKRAEEALRESEERLHLMADALPVLISYIDADCRYQFNNASYEHWFGLPKDAYKGRHLREVLGEAAFAALKEHIESVLAGQLTMFEARVPYQLGGTRDVLVNYVPHRNRDGKVVGFYALILDLTERKKGEEALRDREVRLRAILDTAVDAIITIDEEGIIDSVNPATERLFGYTGAEMLGRNVKMLMPPPYHEEHDGYLANYRRTGIRRIIGIGREVQARRKDGSLFPVQLAISEIWDTKRWFTGILHDLSQRKALEQEVLEIANQEQQRIGQELHDSVGQELTGLGMMAGALARRLEGSSPVEGQLAIDLTQGLIHVHQQVRTLCRGLIPVELDAEGLQVALLELATRTHEQSGIACGFDCPEPVLVPDLAAAKHLYRIAQEAVSNALRHGRPRHICLALCSGPQGLSLSIQDDGSGMPERAEPNQGMGLSTMRYRAGMIGGTLQIGPAEAGGTLVTCNIPRRTGHVEE